MNRKIVDFYKEFTNNFSKQCIFKESAALTFVTILGFIPFLIFIFFLLPELPFFQMETQLKKILISIFVPKSADQISEYVGWILSQKIPFNLFNFIVLLITSYSLFKIINDSFDNILNVHKSWKKGALHNFIRFLGMTLFGGLLILLLFSATSIPIVSNFIELQVLQSYSLYLTPFFLLFIVFALGFFLIPNIKVRNRSIVIGSASSAIVWIVFKSLFNWYIASFTNIELIFGVLASIPIFFFWIYSNWIIILSGVLVVSILEKRHLLNRNEEKCSNKIRISFEKILGDDSYNKIATTTITRKELKKLLEDLLHREEES